MLKRKEFYGGIQLQEFICGIITEQGRLLFTNVLEKLLVVEVYVLCTIIVAWEQVAMQHDTVHRAPEAP
jgi:hypothetical protein